MIHDLSLGEVQSLALKATRGAGRSHGIAEEAAFAVRWLTERGHDGAGQLAALLQASDGALDGCPLCLGAALSDAGNVPDAPLGPVHCPLLLAPFLVALCCAETGLRLKVGAAHIRLAGNGAIAGTALPTAADTVRLARCAPPPNGARTRRAQVDDATLEVLTAFAFRTYAPATEESRAKGAGAGLSDND